ncbi:MAG: sigma-70 family RNA polymerase sigma factor [Bacteroidota bacterium]
MFSSVRNKYKTWSDEELITVIKDGDKSGVLGIIYERYGHLVMGTCMKYLKNVMDAEDLLSHIFEILPKKLQSHNIQNFKSWLYMVTKNECLMVLRKSKRSVEIPEELLVEESEINHLERETQFTITEQSLLELKEEQRICIELFYLQDKSYKEISDQLQLDIKQVKSAIQNGKRNLKMKLEEHHEFKTDKK